MPVTSPRAHSNTRLEATSDSDPTAFDSELVSQWGGNSVRRTEFALRRQKGQANAHRGSVPSTTCEQLAFGSNEFAQVEIETVRTGMIEVLRENARLRTEIAGMKTEVVSMRTLLLQLRDNLFDLSPISLYEVDTDDYILKLRIPRKVEVCLSPDGKLLCAVDEDLGIDAFAKSRPELIREVHSQLRIIWVEYAKAADDSLSAAARLLKARLRDTIAELCHAG